jgi:hypothetical protein
MKTNQEIQAEAQRLLVLGSQFQNEQRIVSGGATAVAEPRVMVNLPVNAATPGRERHVEAVIAGGALLFRLMERETDRAASDRNERDDEASVVVSSASAYDVLKTGYELAEEERLAAALERYAERSDDPADPADDETVAEVEAIVETKLLPPTDRLRTKAEIVEFLEGRLEPSVFIARAIKRQCSREGCREHLAERHELKLTMGGP